MMKKRLTRRLFAVCLGLIIVLSACASTGASVDAPSGGSTTTEESKATSALELSEVNAEGTSSEAEPSDEESSESEPSTPDEHLSADAEASLSGGITITPIEPTYPEERETTLELVKEYPLGEGGIPFYLLYENDPTIADIIVAWFLADENGNIYAYNGERFYDLQNKTSFVPPREECLIAREIAIDEKLYCLTLDGTLNIYNAHGEKTNSVQYPKRSENGTYDLFAAPDGTLRVVVDGTFYNASGKKIASDYVLDSVNQKADSLGLLGREYFYSNDLYVKCYADEILTAYESQCHTVYTDGLAEIAEYLIYQYDKNGDPLSEFMIYRLEQSEKVSCDIFYEDVVCKSFTPCSIVVGKHRFDNLIDANWFVGADGTIYLMVIDPNGGKLYKINPGYSDVEFTDYEAGTEIQQTAATASTTTTHANVSADVAETRAEAMAELTWSVQPEHRNVRAGAALPDHLAKEDYNLTQTGIPYCWGGYNGIDTVDYAVYRGICFADIVTQDASDGRLYMAGNTEHVIVANTIGLDCSGYACSAYGFVSRTDTGGLARCGHGISENELQPMDALVYGSVHCYLFVAREGDAYYWVYDCTASGELDYARYRRIAKTDCNYSRRRLCYTYTSTTTHHTYSCSECGISEDEEHQFVYETVSSVQHRKTCAECGYNVKESHTYVYEHISATKHRNVCTWCGYSVVRSHSFTGGAISSTTHVKSCSLCGYSISESHTFTYPSYTTSSHTKRCSECSYSTTETHSYTYTSLSSATHKKACTKCNYSVSQSHTNAIRYNTTHHWNGCVYCSYAINKEEHLMLLGGCLGCPYEEGNILHESDEPEEPSTEPPVSDEPFVVLCVPHEDELFERIRR